MHLLPVTEIDQGTKSYNTKIDAESLPPLLREQQ